MKLILKAPISSVRLTTRLKNTLQPQPLPEGEEVTAANTVHPCLRQDFQDPQCPVDFPTLSIVRQLASRKYPLPRTDSQNEEVVRNDAYYVCRAIRRELSF